MKKFFALIAVLALIALPTFAVAADPSAGPNTAANAAGDTGGTTVGTGLAVLAAGLAVIGAGIGIGRIGGSAMEGIARQPEAGARIAANMIIAAALIEGATLFAIVVALLKA